MVKKYLFILLPCLIFFLNIIIASAQIDISYQTPPEEMIALVDAPTTPSVWVSPDGNWMLMLGEPNLPPIEEVAQPELRIAGLRINPVTNGRSRSGYYNSMKLLRISDNVILDIKNLPEAPRITNVEWSPDAQKAAFCMVQSGGIELWYLDIMNAEVHRLTGPVINDVLYGRTFQWHPDSRTIIFKSIDKERGQAPEKSMVPSGPVIHENVGKTSAVWTYQDLLKNPYDEKMFEYYANARLNIVSLNGDIQPVGSACLIGDFSVSPDGSYILIEIIHRPYSYTVPYYYFPVKAEIWNIEGKLIKELSDLPLADDIPKGFGSVRKGPRSYLWRADASSDLYWVEALDDGDASKEVDYRDQLFRLKAPFNSEPEALWKYRLRFGGISWGTGNLAISYEYWRKTRRSVTNMFYPDDPGKEPVVLFDRSSEDIYNDPGSFITKMNSSGYYVLMTADKGKSLFLRGMGASLEGHKPFIDKYSSAKKTAMRLWQSSPPYYEFPVNFADPDKGVVITRRESVNEPPNYFIRDLKSKVLKQITYFPHPHPQLSDVQKIFLKYHRKDGILLTATLYLPYKDETKNKDLPVLMWAYPREYKSADAAGQVDDSPYRFNRISYWSPMIWLTRGYAVMDDPKMPIIGEGDIEPNDTYVEQLVMSAEAAVDTLVAMGVADPHKIAIGGHSYGAFMTANLLVYSDLFATGIARSGAYNRTLTPFGFQAEERTYWEAPDVYYEMSPFMHADKINEPILLIHGEADNNSGTFPIQSERFYDALKGNGATVRLVILPNESHGYRARESILHMLWEMDVWMEKYVKGD